MAVGNLIKGTSAGGLASYLLGSHDHNGDERPRADKIGGTIIGDTVKEITQEAEDLHALRPSLGKHIAHMSINFSPEDRQLTDQEQAEIGAFWAEGMGFESYAIFSHGDHEHILASRVKSDGSVVSDSNDWARSEKLIREIEQRWDLVKVEASHLLEPEKGRDHKTTLSMSEIALAEKGEPSARLELQQMLDDLLSEPVTATEFVDHLEAAGVDVRPNVASTGRLNGFSYGYEGYSFTSKTLGRSYSLKNLEAKGFSYDKNTESTRLSEALTRSKELEFSRSSTTAIERDTERRRDPEPTRTSDDAPNLSNRDANESDEVIDEASRSVQSENDSRSGQSDESNSRAEQDFEHGSVSSSAPGHELGKDAGRDAGAATGSAKSSHNDTSSKPSSGAGRGSSGMASGSPSVALETVILEGEGFEALIRFFRKWAAAWAKYQSAQEQARKLAGSGHKAQKFEPKPGSSYDNIMSFAGGGRYQKRNSEIAKQLESFGCSKFEVQAIPHKGSSLKTDSVRTVDAAGAMKLSNYLGAKNAQGYDIYVRPAALEIEGEQYGQPYVFVDDIKPADMAKLRDAGLPLAITMESSPGNFQGWIRVGSTPLKAEELTAAAKIVAKTFGGDPGSADWRHHGRLAGYTNQKPTRRQSNGYAPFVQMKAQKGHDIAPNGPALIHAARQKLEQEEAKKAKALNEAAVREEQQYQSTLRDELAGTDVYSFVSEARERLRKGEDESATDFSAALSALRKGFDRDHVKAALRACSTNLGARKGDGVDRYLEHTLDRAEDVVNSSPSLRQP